MTNLRRQDEIPGILVFPECWSKRWYDSHGVYVHLECCQRPISCIYTGEMCRLCLFAGVSYEEVVSWLDKV